MPAVNERMIAGIATSKAIRVPRNNTGQQIAPQVVRTNQMLAEGLSRRSGII